MLFTFCRILVKLFPRVNSCRLPFPFFFSLSIFFLSLSLLYLVCSAGLNLLQVLFLCSSWLKVIIRKKFCILMRLRPTQEKLLYVSQLLSCFSHFKKPGMFWLFLVCFLSSCCLLLIIIVSRLLTFPWSEPNLMIMIYIFPAFSFMPFWMSTKIRRLGTMLSNKRG